MNVELTIQEMFDKYPTLFKERADCLNHLFCVIGNGYSWVNGELVLNEDKITKKEIKILESRLVDGKAFQHNKLSLKAEAIIYLEESVKEGFYEEFPAEVAEKLIEARKKTIDKLPDDVYYRSPRSKRWGFYVNIPGKERIDYHKEYAELWNYPTDIKPDWIEAIEECKLLLREDGFEV